ncbi:MAG TPA: outer membrane protein assembly factor BamA [Anaeromyxobacteraceae bacterium]|nr:outer membrane protein assembly factor BamA [Anaeromyxobacteraceae bacterium]
MKRLLAPLLGACVALSLATHAAPAAAQEAPVVADIRVEGNRRVEIDAVRAALSQKRGQALEATKIDADIRALMKLGYFSDVVVELEPRDDGTATLVYRVVERPTIRDTRIEGNDEIGDEDLKESVQVQTYQILDPAAVAADVKRIQEKYVEKGYYLAEVRYELEELADNQVNVVFRVDENAKVEVKQVKFLGAEKVPVDQITPFMQTREGGLLGFLTRGGTYKDDAFQHDLEVVQAVYLDKGYLNVKVGKPAISLTPDRRYLYITIPVEEGERFKIGEISFSGTLLDQDAKLKGLVKTKTGDWFSRSKVGADLFAVTDVFKDLGYAYAQVTPLTNPNDEARTVDLSFQVNPGVPVRFERIEIVGNSKTRDKVIRRELRIYEGEKFSGTAIRTSKNRVNALGFFETVEITTRKGSADDLIVATVEVKERATGQFQVGAGFSSYENFILTGQITQNNFFGWGQTLSLQVQWSSVRQLGQIQFVEPYFLDTRWTFAFDVYATEGYYTNFTRRAVGGNLTWGYELSGLSEAFGWKFAERLEDVRLFATYTNEYVDLSRSSSLGTSGGPLENRFQDGTTSAVRFSLNWDKRDNRLFPTDGFFLSGSYELAPPLLAPEGVFGNVNLFTRWTLDARVYQPIWKSLVARAKLTLGHIRQWDTSHPLPISELYYVGGINSVRGYRYLSIAPTENILQEPGGMMGQATVGGNTQLVLNTELEFPLFSGMGVRGVIFSDWGNAFSSGSDLRTDHPTLDLYKSVGFGFRWLSPVGPLRFEWGIPLDRRKNTRGDYTDNAVDFQFTIGNFF